MHEANPSEWIRAAVASYERPLLLYALRLVGDMERAQDVVQDTFLRLCREDPREIGSHLAEWLFAVCRTRALDMRRRDGRWQSGDVTADGLPGDWPAPEDVLERDEAAAEAVALLETLTPNQREVLRLKFQQGLSYKEISAVTGLSVTNVGFLIHTGLKTLRRKMGVGAELSDLDGDADGADGVRE